MAKPSTSPDRQGKRLHINIPASLVRKISDYRHAFNLARSLGRHNEIPITAFSDAVMNLVRVGLDRKVFEGPIHQTVLSIMREFEHVPPLGRTPKTRDYHLDLPADLELTIQQYYSAARLTFNQGTNAGVSETIRFLAEQALKKDDPNYPAHQSILDLLQKLRAN